MTDTADPSTRLLAALMALADGDRESAREILGGGAVTFADDSPETAFRNLAAGRPMPGYVPSYENGIAHDNVYETAGETGVPWIPTPASGHVYRFRYFDATGNARFLRRGAVLEDPIGKGRSELHVQFKTKDGTPDASYRYFFDTPGAGAEIARKMGETDHPYSEVLYPLVIRPKTIPYTRVSNA